MRSPFTGFRFARLEFNNFHAGTMIKLAIIGISFIPLIYGGLFLLAFLDPYGSLSNVPAAVVNLDKGAEINGEQKNVGNELCDSLVKNNENAKEGEASGYKWTFVDRQEADRGLEDATYYMELIIPENFSESIASADSKNPEVAELEVYFNPSTNLIAQTVGSSMVTKIKSELNTKVEKEYFDNIFIKIEDAAEGFEEASEGSEKLEDGLQKLEDGSSTLSSGIATAKDGSGTIHDKLGDLTEGAKKVDNGVETLSSNLEKLDKGVSDAQKSSAKLSKEILGVANSLQSYQKSGKNSDLEKAKKHAAKAKKLNPTIGKDLNKYVTQLISSLKKYQAASSESAAAKATMDADQKKVASAVAKLRSETSGIDEVGDAVKDLDDAVSSRMYRTDLNKFISITQKALAAISDFLVVHDASSVDSLRGYSKELIADLKAFETNLTNYQTSAGVYQAKATKEALAGADASEKKGNCTGYLMGVKNTSAYANKSSKTVSDAIGKLHTAVSGSLADGTSKVADGSSKLEEGAGTLEEGLGTALTGSKKLTVNLGTAKNGANELASKLSDGADTVYENLEGKEDKVEMMSEPVTANGENETGESITHVANYGTGFAPYFIGLGAWVGALMVSMLIRCLNNRILMSGASSIAAVLSSYIPIATVCILQEMMLLLFVQFGLGMEVKYPLAFYLFGVLTAMCFAAIIQFFRASMGTVGMVVIVILLMVQLCTAAGTFPIQAELPVFNWLNPFLPMTYVVQGFRMAMAGLSLDYLWPACGVLFAYMIVFGIFTYLYARRRRRVTMSQLYPPIKLASG